MRYTIGGKAELFTWPQPHSGTAGDTDHAALEQSMLNELQMFIQYFNRGLKENRLGPPPDANQLGGT
ncbi:MAG: hypothetical protein RMH97_05350 [Verrucomicrobiales bacterium]|nr:hypothetical protein [Verrucomicrobiales bacterium]